MQPKRAYSNPQGTATNTASPRILLLNSHRRNRSIDLAKFLAADPQILYYATTDADSDPKHLLQSLLQAFGESQLQPKPKRASVSRETLLTALGTVIASQSPHYVVLDDLDRLSVPEQPNDETVGLLQAMAAILPDYTQLVLSGRGMEYKSWLPLIETGEAQMVHGNDKPLTGRIEIYGFEGGTVYADGHEVTVWDGPLPRNLFFYFADHPLSTRRDIFQVFWPDMPTRDAANVFHVTKRKIAERVGYDTMDYARGFYRRAANLSFYYDVEDFEAAIAQGRANPDDFEAWRHAVELYRQPFNHKLNTRWALERRQKLAADCTEALIELGRYERPRDLELSLSYYLRAERESPFREDVCRAAMTIYAELGSLELMNTQYQILTARLERAYNLEPDRTTRELYAKLASASSIVKNP